MAESLTPGFPHLGVAPAFQRWTKLERKFNFVRVVLWLPNIRYRTNTLVQCCGNKFIEFGSGSKLDQNPGFCYQSLK